MVVAALSIALPLTLAVVLVVSGIAKLRTPDDVEGWRELGVPAAFRRSWLVALHPWGEIVLGVVVAVLGGVLGVLAACVATALMLAYTTLVVAAVRRPEEASCACFGARAPLSARTVVRNVWLTVLSAACIAVIGVGPLAGGAVVASGGTDLGWLVGALVAVITSVVIMRSEATAEPPAPAATAQPVGSASASDDDLDYIRVRTPAVPVTLADGTVQNLRSLAARKPILLLAVSPTCGACQPVIAGVARYRSLLPEVDVRLLLMDTPEHSTLTETAEPQSLHDPDGYVRGSIADWPTPTAVLLGMDGMLAGGPEIGSTAVDAFVADIYENLHGERPPQEAAEPVHETATH